MIPLAWGDIAAALMGGGTISSSPLFYTLPPPPSLSYAPPHPDPEPCSHQVDSAQVREHTPAANTLFLRPLPPLPQSLPSPPEAALRTSPSPSWTQRGKERIQSDPPKEVLCVASFFRVSLKIFYSAEPTRQFGKMKFALIPITDFEVPSQKPSDKSRLSN